MKNRFKIITAITLILSITTLLFAGCSKSEPTSTGTKSTDKPASTQAPAGDKPKVVKVVTNNNYYPLTYLDESGKLVGYAIDVANLVDEALPQYEFNIEPSSGDAILLGLESGTYDVAIGGFYWNPDREKKFIYPEFDGGGIVGVVAKKENSDVKDLSAVATKGLKVAPTLAIGGIIGVLNKYNEQNPNNKVKFDTIESRTEADIWKGILDGRYDVDVANKHTWNQIVATEEGKKFKDALVFNSFTVVKSYDLFNKSQIQLATDYSEVIKKLKTDGTLSKLSEKWFGEDLFKLITDDDK